MDAVLFQTFERKDFEIFLADQAVLQVSLISRSCVIPSMSYCITFFEDPAQHIHTIVNVSGVIAGEPEATLHVNNKITSMFNVCNCVFCVQDTHSRQQ